MSAHAYGRLRRPLMVSPDHIDTVRPCPVEQPAMTERTTMTSYNSLIANTRPRAPCRTICARRRRSRATARSGYHPAEEIRESGASIREAPPTSNLYHRQVPSRIPRRHCRASFGSRIILGVLMDTVPTSSAPITLPPLPWAENALDPVISANTISFHYGKHHKTYVDNVNKLIAGTEYADLPLEKIVNVTAGKADKSGIFNNAAQIWNH